MNPGAIHYQIAQEALSGQRLALVAEALWFFNPYSDVCPPNFPSGVGAWPVRIGRALFLRADRVLLQYVNLPGNRRFGYR